MKKALTLFFVASLAFSCEYETIAVVEEVPDEEMNHSIAGSWLYVEYGYSPGAGYHTVPVPAIPPQTIIFEDDFTISSTIAGFEMYKYYRLLQDTAIDRQVIAFFEKDPGNEPLDLAGLTHAYSVSWHGNDLNLGYRWCFEGCHMKFKRISSPDLNDPASGS